MYRIPLNTNILKPFFVLNITYIMISFKHKCIFVHIPKCGGSSVEEIIWEDRRDVSDLWMGFITKYRNKYQTGGLQHLYAKHIKMEVGSDIFAKYFKFAIVRNPWDKAVSQYSYMQHRKDLRKYIGMGKRDSFKKYLYLIKHKTHVQWDHQYKFVFDNNGDLMVDFLGRFENFEQDLNYILTHLNIRGRKIPHKKKTNHLPYPEYYDSESLEMINEFYKMDIQLFGYSF